MTNQITGVLTVIVAKLNEDIVSNDDVLIARIDRAGGVESYAEQLINADLAKTKNKLSDAIKQSDLNGPGEQICLPGMASASLPRIIVTADGIKPQMLATVDEVKAHIKSLERIVNRNKRVVEGYAESIAHLEEIAVAAGHDTSWNTIGHIMQTLPAITAGN